MNLVKVGLVLCLLISPLSATSEEVVFFGPFGSTNSCAIGMNEPGDIVGWYSKGVTNGYLRTRHGTEISLQAPAPNVAGTQAWRINNQSDVVGQYWTTAGRYYGFLLRGSSWTTVDFPGSTNTIVMGLNNQGDIVGSYTLAGGPTLYSFMLTRHGEYVSFEPQAGVQFATTRPWAINSRGDIAGEYNNNDGTGSHAFLLTKSGEFITLDPPGRRPTGPTRGLGVTESGWVSGDYTDLSGKTRSFLWSDGQFITYDLPDAVSTSTASREFTNAGYVVGCARRPDVAGQWSYVYKVW